MGVKYVGQVGTGPNDLALMGTLDTFVTVVTGDEARPNTTGIVIWVGGIVLPSNMIDGDLWYTPGIPAVPTGPTITTTTLTTLVQGSAFTQTLNATGDAPITWSVISGTLPTGLSLNSSNGVISGTPTTTGAYSFTVQADNAVDSDTQAFSGSVNAAAVAPTITTTSVATMTVDSVYSQSMAATGDTPITWGVSAGALPSGLTMNSSSGSITGTPTTAGAYDFTVQATNAAGSDTQNFTGTVEASSVGTDTFSIFEYGVPANVSSNSDAGTSAWLGHQYYPASTAPTDWYVTGVRIYVPPGSSLIGVSGDVSMVRNGNGAVNLGVPTNSQFNSSPAITTVPALTAGWNEIMFGADYLLTPGEGFWVAYKLNGYYLYNGNLSPNVPILGADRAGIFLSERVGAFTRSVYDGGVSTSCWYGIEPIIKGTKMDATGPWTRRTPFNAFGNGTTTQTVAFKAATAGNKLVAVVVSNAPVSTPAGWTLQQSAVSNCALYLFAKTASEGENTFTLVTSSADYTVIGVVYEFDPVTSIISAKTDSLSETAINPEITGLTGTNQLFAVKAANAGNSWAGASWNFAGAGQYEDVILASMDTGHPSGFAQGPGFSVGVWENSTSSTFQPTGQSRVYPLGDNQSAITFAVKLA